jgi:hypothetical protein
MKKHGYEQASLVDVLANVELDANDPWAAWVGMPEFAREDLTSFDHVIVHFACEEDMQAFEQLVGQRLPHRSRVGKSIWYPAAGLLTNNGLAYISDES